MKKGFDEMEMRVDGLLISVGNLGTQTLAQTILHLGDSILNVSVNSKGRVRVTVTDAHSIGDITKGTGQEVLFERTFPTLKDGEVWLETDDGHIPVLLTALKGVKEVEPV